MCNIIFTKLFNWIKENNKDYYTNNIIDHLLILYLEEKDINNNINNIIINILKKGEYTKWDNLYIFVFYNNLLNYISGKWKYIKIIDNEKNSKKNNSIFKELFEISFWQNTWRKKFEILKYWQDFSWNKNKIYSFIKFLEKNKIVEQAVTSDFFLFLKSNTIDNEKN